MEDHRGQAIFLNEFTEFFGNLPFLIGSAVIMGNHQIIVLVYRQLFSLCLGGFHVKQGFGDRLREKHGTDAALGLGCLEDERCSGCCGLLRGKGKNDVGAVTAVQSLKAGFVAAFQFLVDIDACGPVGNAFIGDVNAIPGQAKDFANTRSEERRVGKECL